LARAKKEDQLQIKCVNAFGFIHSKESKNLWSTRNFTVNERDGANQKKMGMLAGVADLVYFNQQFVAVELKAPDSSTRHAYDHIKSQYDWGKSMVDCGGFYYIATTVEAFLHAIKEKPDPLAWSKFKGLYHLKDIDHLLSSGLKTIKFN
jgi:hypothetical protein